MFDQISRPSSDVTACSWKEELQRGDTVCARFPLAEGDGEPCKRRPCLVLEVGESNGKKTAVIAYGTTSLTKANSGYEVRVSRPEVLLEAGLHAPTRFVCARRLVVRLDNSMFEAPEGSGRSPILGRLTGPELERLNAVRARLQAEADIAAERRAERVSGRRTIEVKGREVVVETRSRRRPSRPATVAAAKG